jgi:hypothetical protein
MEREGIFHVFKFEYLQEILNETREAYIQYFAGKFSKELILKIY